jgi:small-conductance mechanosensitive channel
MLATGPSLDLTLLISESGLRARLSTAGDQLLEIGLNLFAVAVIFLIARYTAKFIQRRIWKRIPIDEVTPATESLVNNTLALCLYALAFTLTLAFLGASWSTLLTAFSVSTLAVVFGLADLLKSILGGAFLIIERPYEVGDRIKIRDNEGEVTEIGVRTTTLMTDDRAAVIIPNSLHLSEPFRNLDRELQVSTVIRVIGIDGERESVYKLIAEILGTDPPIESHVALTAEGQAGFIDKVLTVASRHGFGSNRRKNVENPNTTQARIRLKVDQSASRETEADALARLRATFPNAIVSVRRSSLVEDERQDVD